jgi:ribosomal protein S18 acetylase RimI-like enzyme
VASTAQADELKVPMPHDRGCGAAPRAGPSRMPDLLIRPAVPADVERLCALAVHTFRQTYRGLSDPDEIEDYVRTAFAPDAVGAWLRETASRTLLALLDSQVAGYARVRRSIPPACVEGPEPAELARLYLDASAHGKGHGAAMMRACMAEARALGAQTIWLSAYDRNRRALEFYAAWEFVVVGTRPFEFGGRLYADPVLQRAVPAP